MRAKYPSYHNLPYIVRNSKFFSVIRSKKGELFKRTLLFRIDYFSMYLSHWRRKDLPYALFQATASNIFPVPSLLILFILCYTEAIWQLYLHNVSIKYVKCWCGNIVCQSTDNCMVIRKEVILCIQGDQNVSVHLMITMSHYLAQSDCLAADCQGQGDTRLTLTPSVIPISNYVITVSD
jgi:hypothetical protein